MSYAQAIDRSALLDRFRTGYDDVVDALAGITPDEPDRQPPDGGWTAREIAHHLPDSDATAYVRLRRLIAEDNPTIVDRTASGIELKLDAGLTFATVERVITSRHFDVPANLAIFGSRAAVVNTHLHPETFQPRPGSVFEVVTVATR